MLGCVLLFASHSGHCLDEFYCLVVIVQVDNDIGCVLLFASQNGPSANLGQDAFYCLVVKADQAREP